MPAINLTDLSNAKLDVDHIAAIATSANPTATDRLGATKKTIAGIVAAGQMALSVEVYATTSAGLAATTSGKYFSVPSADAAESLILYLNSAGTAVEQKRYPSKAGVDAVRADFLSVGKNRVLNAAFAKNTLGALALGAAPIGYTTPQKAGTAGYSFPAGAIVAKANKLTRANTALELTHSSSASTASDYISGQIIDIPPELWGDVTAVVRVLVVAQHEVSGLNLQLLANQYSGAGGTLANPTVTKLTTDGAVGTWFTAAFDIALTDATARKVAPLFRSQAVIGPTLAGRAWIGGMFVDFNRPSQFAFDSNGDETRKDVADTQSAVALAPYLPALSTAGTNAADIAALRASEPQAAPWKIGSNSVINPLLTVDPVGYTGVPNGFLAVGSGGGGTTPAAYCIVSAKTPFLTNRAFGVTHSYDGALKTDNQPSLVVDIPDAYWGDTTLKARFIYYANVSDSRISCLSAGNFFSSASADLGTMTTTKVSTDGAAGTWFPVIHDVTITNASARRLKFNARTQASNAGGVFSGATCLLTAFSVGWNRATQTSFDRNLAYEADMLAKVRVDALRTELAAVTPVSQRTVVGVFDQYTDARGNVLPMLPTTVIECFGDSLTAAEYPGYLASRFAATPRTVKNCGIGSEISSEILARIKGHDAYTAGTVFTPGTVRLKTRRAVPPRTINETYRLQWGTFGVTVAEPSKVEFFNSAGLIGSTRLQLKAAATVSGAVLSATAHPFANGDEVYHLGTGLPAGMYAGKVYYVRDVSVNAYSLAEFSGGAAVSFGSGAATTLGPFYLDWAYTSQNTTITAITHTDKDLGNAVLWMGANNIASTQQVKDDIVAAFNHIKTLAKRVLVMTVLPNESYLPATAAGISLANVNAWILAEFPNNSVNALGYLQSKGDGSANDNADIANTLTPRSLRIDAIHLTGAGLNHIADLVHAFFLARGW